MFATYHRDQRDSERVSESRCWANKLVDRCALHTMDMDLCQIALKKVLQVSGTTCVSLHSASIEVVSQNDIRDP
jgi:hypothetical protein